jgi:hypothetical protein
MKFRLAKPRDANHMARLHLNCGKIQIGGFMHILGYRFLNVYYKGLICDSDSVIIIAESDDDNIIGFISGSVDAEKRLLNLKRRKYIFLFALLPRLALNPRLILLINERRLFVNQDRNAINFGVTSGVRMEYLAWDNVKKSTSSMTLLKVWNQVIFSLGYDNIRGEVDLVNKGILNIHKFLGAKVIQELDTKDGRKRVVIEYQNK